MHWQGSGDWSLVLLRPGAPGRAPLCSSCLLLLFSAADQLSAGRGSLLPFTLYTVPCHNLVKPEGPGVEL